MFSQWGLSEGCAICHFKHEQLPTSLFTCSLLELISNLYVPVPKIWLLWWLFFFPQKYHSRKCVSWDTSKGRCLFLCLLYVASTYKTRLNWWFPHADSLQVNWTTDGCKTHHRGSKQTECLCNHLTYFSVLVVRQRKQTSRTEITQHVAHREKKDLVFVVLLPCSSGPISDSNYNLVQSATYWLWASLHLWAVPRPLSAALLSSFISAGRGNTTLPSVISFFIVEMKS